MRNTHHTTQVRCLAPILPRLLIPVLAMVAWTGVLTARASDCREKADSAGLETAGQTPLSSPYYLTDDVQYFRPRPQFRLARDPPVAPQEKDDQVATWVKRLGRGWAKMCSIALSSLDSMARASASSHNSLLNNKLQHTPVAPSTPNLR